MDGVGINPPPRSCLRPSTARLSKKEPELLAKHGASLKDVVKITTYLVDTRECPDYHRARREAFAGIGEIPAHTLIIAQGLAWPGMLVEIDMTAAIPGV